MDLHNTKSVQFLYPEALKTQYNIEARANSLISAAGNTSPAGHFAKLLIELSNASSIQSFKDTQKRLRKHLKDNPLLYTEAQPLILSLALSLCRESTLGNIPDIKGLINDLVNTISSQESFTVDISAYLKDSWIQYLQQNGKFGGPEEELVYEEIDEKLKVMNQFGELLSAMDEHAHELVDPLLDFYINILKRFAIVFENNKHHSAQFLTELNFILRGCVVILTNFQDIIAERVDSDDNEIIVKIMTISLCCRLLLTSIQTLNYKSISQCSILAVLIDSNLIKVEREVFESFHFNAANEIQSPFTAKVYTQTPENLKKRKLLIIQALILFQESFDIFSPFSTINETPFSAILTGSKDSNAHVRLTGFKTLQTAMESVKNVEFQRKGFFEDSNRYLEVFDLLLANWESPIKGITQHVEAIFETLLKVIQQCEKRSQDRMLFEIKNRIAISSPKKKYGALILLLPYVDIWNLLQTHKGLILELLTSNREVYVASAVTLLEKLLQRIHADVSSAHDSKEDSFNKWASYWIDDFIHCLENEEFKVVKGILTHFIPVVCKVNPMTYGYLINLLENKDLTKKSILWCYISLLKSARDNNLLHYTEDRSAYQLSEDVVRKKGKLFISESFLKTILLSSNRNIMLSALELLTVSPKPGDVPSSFEYNLVLAYLKYNLRNSFSETRNTSIVILYKFFIRVRTLFDSLFLQNFPASKTTFSQTDLKPEFQAAIDFIRAAFTSLIENLKPEIEYETAFPTLEFIKAIFQIFGLKDFSYKKNVFFKGISLLHYLDAFQFKLFNSLLVCIKSAWQSTRTTAYEILLEFPDYYKPVDSDFLHKILIQQALDLTKDPVIKNYEGGALILTLAAQKFAHLIDFSVLQKELKVESNSHGAAREVRFASLLLGLLQTRFEEFQKHFLVNQAEFADNLVHGLITTLRLSVQELTAKGRKEELSDQKDLKHFFSDLIATISKITAYTTKVASEEMITCIIEKDPVLQKLNNNIQIKRSTATDCRGHFFVAGPEEPTKQEAAENLEQILAGGEVEEEGAEGNGEVRSENIAVISFYLIARESGLLLESISDFLKNAKESNLSVIEPAKVKSLVFIFFHALFNLKHLGAIDGIVHGLSVFCRNLSSTRVPELANTGEELLDIVLNALKNEAFKSVLRRSSGIPHAITCLLKSEPYGQKAVLFPRTMNELLTLAESGKTQEIKVHALNVLKFVFQDATLKTDIEAFISRGLIISIKEFASNDWVIRNSALMLFSSISKRVVGAEKIADQQSTRHNITLLEFFARAPELVDFFLQEVENYIEKQWYRNPKGSLYPSVYPIALIMSRLHPSDTQLLESQDTAAYDDESETGENRQVGENQRSVAEKLERFLPLFVKAAHNRNYMGRLMCAKAVLPFVSQNEISRQVLKLLNMKVLADPDHLKGDFNFAHGLLLQIYYLIKNYFLLKTPGSQRDQFQQDIKSLIAKLGRKKFLMIFVDCPCPTVSIVYLQILKKFLKHIDDLPEIVDSELFAYAYGYCLQMLKEECTNKEFRIAQDFGGSILRIKFLQYVLVYDRTMNKNFEAHKALLQIFTSKYEEIDMATFQTDDHELFETLLAYIKKYLKTLGPNSITNDDKKYVLMHLLALFKNKKNFLQYDYLPCITEILSIVLHMDCREIISSQQTSDLLQLLNELYGKYSQNTRLMKSVIRLYGSLLSIYLDSNGWENRSNVLKYYNAICENFSNATQPDFLRVAVVQSLQLSLKSFATNVKEIDQFLAISRILIRLLQDEIPEIRAKIASLVSKIFKLSNEPSQFKLNPDYILEAYFEFILSNFEQRSYDEKSRSQKIFVEFILSHIFESEFDEYSETAHFEKRIYAIDKPNKFHSLLLVQKIAYSIFERLVVKHIASQDDLKEYIRKKDYNFSEVAEKNFQEYSSNALSRDEFLFESILKKTYQDTLLERFSGSESQFSSRVRKNESILDPPLRIVA